MHLRLRSPDLLHLAKMAGRGMEDGAARAMGTATRSLLDASKQYHPFWKDWTGNLRDAIKSEGMAEAGGVFSSAVYIDDAQAPYGAFQYYGTRDHGPVSAPFLVFKTRDGRTVCTKWVRGIKGDPWIERQAEAPLGPFLRPLQDGLDKAFEKLFR